VESEEEEEEEDNAHSRRTGRETLGWMRMADRKPMKRRLTGGVG